MNLAYYALLGLGLAFSVVVLLFEQRRRWLDRDLYLNDDWSETT